MKVSFVLNCGLYSKILKYSRKRDMIQIQDAFENACHCLENGQEFFFIKRTPLIILISENSFKFGIIVFVVVNKMLVKVLIFDFTSRYRPGS